LRDGDDRSDDRQRAVAVAAQRPEVWRIDWVKFDGESGALEAAVEALDGAQVDLGAVVGKEQRAQSFSDIECALEAASGEPRSGLEEISFDEPVGQCRRAVELLTVVAVGGPVGVDECPERVRARQVRADGRRAGDPRAV
jgi:hypothetical protein